MMNYSILADDDVSKMYYYVDVDSMTKIMIQKEMVLMNYSKQEKVTAKENLYNKIV